MPTTRPEAKRNDRNVAGDIGVHRAGHIQFGRLFVPARGDHRKLLGMIHLECRGILFMLDLRGQWPLRRWVRLSFAV